MYIFGNELRNNIGIFRERVFDDLSYIGFDLLSQGIGNKAETQYHHQAKEKPNADKDGHG